MKQKKLFALLLALTLLLTACSPAAGEGEPAETEPAAADTAPVETPPESPSEPPEEPDPAQLVGEIWLYGELHAEKSILDEELRLWKEAYDRGLRHLFVEEPYYTAEFLNLWMAEEDDAILERLYADWAGTVSQDESVKAFYQAIKADCPETVFHGTDLGHQYKTTGKRYLVYLRENGLEDTEQFRLAQECVEQGELYYSTGKNIYREKMLTENFIRELERLEGEEIVGFYGAAHTGTDPFDYGDGRDTVSVTMAAQLQNRYGEKLHLESLTYLAVDDLEPERTDNILVGEGVYEASYFGQQDLSAWSDTYSCRDFWRLEDAYEDFRDAPTNGSVLPSSNYPTRLGKGQVYVVDYTRKDGTVERKYYRCDGDIWQGMLTTVEILPGE